jgi:hypothetical protein
MGRPRAGARAGRVVRAALVALTFIIPACTAAPAAHDGAAEDPIPDPIGCFLRDAGVTVGVADEDVLEIPVKRRRLPAHGYYSPVDRRIVLGRGHCELTMHHELGHAAWHCLFELPGYSGPARCEFTDELCATDVFNREAERHRSRLKKELLRELLEVRGEEPGMLRLICKAYLEKPPAEYITFACAHLGRDADLETRKTLPLALDEVFANTFAEWMGGAPNPLFDRMRYRGMRLRSTD